MAKTLRDVPNVFPDEEQLPPYSHVAEQGILGCILLKPDHSMILCAEELKEGANCFYDLRHQHIYAALVEMSDQLEPIDLITLQQKLDNCGFLEQVGGVHYLNELEDSTPSASNLSSYLDIVARMAVLRRIIKTCTETANEAQNYTGEIDALIDKVERTVLAFQKEDTTATLDGKTSGIRMVDDLERRHALQGALSGLDTGLYDLNRMTEGLQFGEQAIIGARPSQGKTALGLNIFQHCAFAGVPSLFISLEMSVEAVMRRMLSSYMRIPMQTIRKGTYDEGHFSKFAIFQSHAAKHPMFIVDAVDGLGIRQLCARVRRHVLKFGIKLVVIDYLQKIKPSERHEKKTYEVGEISGRLKSLAVETNVAMLTLAQLNRESVREKGRAPKLSDLADSGQIERDADLAALIHRDGADTKLIIAKQRDGETGVVHLVFDGTYCRFENATRNGD